MPAFNIADLFELVVDAVPDRPALVAGEVRLSYVALDERATRFANALRDAGVGVGERVAVLSGNRAEWMEVMLGCFKARCAPININYRYTSDEIRYVLRDSVAVVLVVEAELAGQLPTIDDRSDVRVTFAIGGPAPDGAVDYELALAEASAERDSAPRSGDDPYVLYTGGTTGYPKGVVWRAEDFFFAALSGGNPSARRSGPRRRSSTVLAEQWEPWFVTVADDARQRPVEFPSAAPDGPRRRAVDRSVLRRHGHRRLVAQERPQLLVARR